MHHIGTLNRGHYYANIKVGGEWYEMNDDRVRTATISPTGNISKTVYMLIYKKDNRT